MSFFYKISLVSISLIFPIFGFGQNEGLIFHAGDSIILKNRTGKFHLQAVNPPYLILREKQESRDYETLFSVNISEVSKVFSIDIESIQKTYQKGREVFFDGKSGYIWELSPENEKVSVLYKKEGEWKLSRHLLKDVEVTNELSLPNNLEETSEILKRSWFTIDRFLPHEDCKVTIRNKVVFRKSIPKLIVLTADSLGSFLDFEKKYSFTQDSLSVRQSLASKTCQLQYNSHWNLVSNAQLQISFSGSFHDLYTKYEKENVAPISYSVIYEILHLTNQKMILRFLELKK